MDAARSNFVTTLWPPRVLLYGGAPRARKPAIRLGSPRPLEITANGWSVDKAWLGRA